VEEYEFENMKKI